MAKKAEMLKAKGMFFWIGILVVVFALVNTANLFLGDVKGTLEKELLKEDLLTEQKEAVHMLIWVVIGALVVGYLLEIFLGTKAIRISKAPTRAKLHIILGTFILAFRVYSLTGMVSDFEIFSFLLALANTLIMLSYVILACKIHSLAR